jgi:hypothetical protein
VAVTYRFWSPVCFLLCEQLTASAKVSRWFEMLQVAAPLSRPESGFVDGTGEEEGEVSEGCESLINRLRSRKRRKLLGLRMQGRVTTF